MMEYSMQITCRYFLNDVYHAAKKVSNPVRRKNMNVNTVGKPTLTYDISNIYTDTPQVPTQIISNYDG